MTTVTRPAPRSDEPDDVRAPPGRDMPAEGRSGSPPEAARLPPRGSKPRVLFAAVQEPRHRLAFSGAFHQMVRALEDEGFEVEVPGHDLSLSVRVRRLLPLRRLHTPITRSPASIAAAVAVSAQARRDSTVVFAPLASEVVPLLPADLRVVTFSDATPRLLERGYVSDDRMTERDFSHWDAVELAALRRAEHVIYASRWAAESAIHHYGATPSAMSIAPFGSPLDPLRADALSRHLTSPLRLLWVGADWARKGGARAVETLRILRSTGIDAELHLCGGRGVESNAPRVFHHGFLDRGKGSHRRLTAALMRRCHVFLLPTQADCSPLVLAEAAAWGMPAVTTRVGAIHEIVDDGETGLILAPDAGATELAEAVRRIIASPVGYSRYVARARAAYEQRMTWRHWAGHVGRALCSVSAQREEPLQPGIELKGVAMHE